MSTTSTRFQMKLPDGTDGFDNDLYLKGNLQILDTQAAKVAETLATRSALKMEIVEVSFTSSGATSVINGTGNYANTYTSTPIVLAATVTQTVSYVDYMIQPWIVPTTSNFTCRLQVASDGTGTPHNFGSGTVKMKFLVIGS
jgi:hypothetical protein